MGFVLAVPQVSSNDFRGTSLPLQRIREIIDEIQVVHPEVKIGLTGIPVLESDEMRKSQSDMTKASLISFGGVGLILLIGFRGFRHPLLALAMLAVGLIWSLGYTTIVVGHLNILSVSFAAILIGLGIDFAIHYLARYLELRHQDRPLRPALLETAEGVGTGIVTAAVTTSLAFLCATFTSFLGVAELGIIAGGGILLCVVATFVVLPALVTLADRSVEPKRLPTPFQGNLLRYLTRRYPVIVTVASLVVVVGIGLQGFSLRDGQIRSRVTYDSNLLNLQAEGVESVELQKHIFKESNGSLLYAVSLSDSPQGSRRAREKFLELPTVGRVDELGSMMPRYPAAETQLYIQAIHSRLGRLSDLPREIPQVDPLSIGQSVEGLFSQLKGQSIDYARRGAAALDTFLNTFEKLSLEQQITLLTHYQHAMLSALHGQFQALAAASDPEPVSPQDLPASVRTRFVSPQGDWLVRVYPTEQIWDEKPLARFVEDVRSVDPEITGTPLQNFEAVRQIRESYLEAAIYALAIISLVLLIDSLETGPLIVSLVAPLAVVCFAIATVHGPGGSIDTMQIVVLYVVIASIVAAIFDFENVRNSFLALLPPLAGGFLMFGILGLLGVHLNPANLIVLPLVLGIGVDDGVHVIHDFRLQHRRYRTSASTINAITLTSLTSMIGFGSMLVSAHQGLVSLGAVLVVGVGSCLFVSLVPLPAVLTLIAPKRPTRPSEGAAADPPHEADDQSPRIVPISSARSAPEVA